MSKRTTGAAQAAPDPRRRGGKAGKNLQPSRLLRAPAELWALLDRAVEHADCDGFSDWARHVLALAAADELGIDPLEALRSVRAS